MGSCQTKDKTSKSSNPSERVVEGMKNKVRVLQGEINEIMCVRETENQVYERELMVFAFKQAEWKRERKRLKAEMKKLSKILDDYHSKEDQKLMMMRWVHHDHDHHHHHRHQKWELMEEERRDETVEKWKQLYFAIKDELDDLIQKTHQEERLCWRREEEDGVLVELKNELKAKEERIELLQRQLAYMEHQESKKEREMDILRQSLRIMSHRKRATIRAWPEGQSRNFDL